MGKPRDLANVVATGNILADGAVAPAELTGVTSTAAEINILDGVTATAAELNLLDGVTATTAELNHVDGVTSNVQTQMDTKAPVAGPTFTGTATAPTVNASTALQIGGVAITATAAELNKMDGVTVSASDINSVTAKAPIDGATFTGTTTIPTADINGGAIDGAAIGANSASTGAFSTGSFTGDVTLADKIVHDGDTNTAIRFPAADTVTVETGGSERIRIASDGTVGISNTISSSFYNGGNNLVVGSGSGSQGITIYGGAESNLFFADGTSLADNLRGRIEYSHGSEKMKFYVNNAYAMDIDSSGNLDVANGTIQDEDGKIRAIPQSGSDKTSSYTLTTGDVGNFIGIGSGGSITVPNSTFSAGDAISIFNNTSGDRTITLSISTAYIAGTDGDVNSVTLASRGVCTILFISGTVCVLSGNVS